MRILSCQSLNTVALVFCLLHNSFCSLAQSIKPGTKRILFIGNSITYSGGYVNNVEAYLLAVDHNFSSEVINVGLPSETVSGLSEVNHADGKFPRPDLHERLSRVLAATKPDLVFACYGMNDGIYLPFDNSRFKKFKEGIDWLHKEVVKTGARIIHLTPPVFDEKRANAPGYENVLKQYSEWLLQQTKRKWEVVDLHSPMWIYLQAHRKTDIRFGMDGFALANDGVHPGATGHWLMARQIIKYFGFPEAIKQPGITKVYDTILNGKEIIRLLEKRQELLRDAWLTETKHLRPGLPVGLPMTIARDSAAVISKEIQMLWKATKPGK